MLTIIVFVVILSVLVLVHELGHFLVAKFFKIKVEEFGFGFPPKVFSKKIGETEYSLNLLPIGGFVKLYGEDEAGAGRLSSKVEKIKDEERAFYSHPSYQKILIVLAGVFMNFVLAFVLLTFIFGFKGVPVPGEQIIVDQVVKNSPADEAGLKTGERIVSVENVKITTTDQLIRETKKHLGQRITLVVETEKSGTKAIEITPREKYPSTEGPMGVAISQNVVTKKYPLIQAPIMGIKESLSQSYLIILGMVTIFKELFIHATLPEGVAGPVGIAQLTGELVKTSSTAVLSFVALLSLNLAILNILPIPALDGGRLAFILIEAVTKKKVNPKIESYAHAVGIAVLLGLIVLITLHDFLRIFQGKPILPLQ